MCGCRVGLPVATANQVLLLSHKVDAACVAAGFEAHTQPLKSARMALDEISHELAPSQWLEERSADKKPAQQLGTLGGGNHFLEVLTCTFTSHGVFAFYEALLQLQLTHALLLPAPLPCTAHHIQLHLHFA